MKEEAKKSFSPRIISGSRKLLAAGTLPMSSEALEATPRGLKPSTTAPEHSARPGTSKQTLLNLRTPPSIQVVANIIVTIISCIVIISSKQQRQAS